MRIFVVATIAGLIISSTAVAQGPAVVIGDIFEHKIIINVGPIERNTENEFTVSEQTEIEADEAARYGCSLYGRYSYPINISESEGCSSGNWLLDSERELARRAMLGCTKYYLYACGTHQVD